MENKIAFAELKRRIAEKKALLIRKKDQYNASLVSLNRIADEITQLEYDIQTLTAQQSWF